MVAVEGPAVVLAELGRWWPPAGLVRVDEPDAGEAQPSVAPDLVVELSGPPTGPAVGVDGIARPGGWDRLESDLGLFAAEHLAHRVAVHAAVVAWQGAAVVLPGPSHAGKSTLALALADAGAAVLSDEYTLIDPATGLVQGWPRPVRRRMPDGTITRPLVPAPLAAPIPVAVVAAVHHEAGAALDLRPARAADAALDLLANTVPAQRRPGPSLLAASAVARSAAAVRGVRGEASEAAAALLALVPARTGARGRSPGGRA